MRRTSQSSLAACLALTTLALAAGPLHADPTWTMVWNDEFSGAANTAPDSTRWTYDTGGGGWGNGELETYTNSTANTYQDGAGHLVISANYGGGSYTSGRIKTQTLFDQAYGRVEASIQIPQGNGIWPAFWMLGSNINNVGWPACGEIDMMENIGQYNPPNVIGGHIHGPVLPGGGDYYGGSGVGTNYTLPSGNFTGGYHLFAAEWNPSQITFYVDGTAYQTLSSANLPGGGQWVFNHPFFILLNLAVGGVSGTPNSGSFPQQMLVDYVRVYKLTDNGTSPWGGTAVSLPGTIQAENYDTYNDSADPTEPGEGFAYNGLGATNTSGQYRTGDAVSIENCGDAGGGYDVDYTTPGQWLQYTVNVTQSATYSLDVRVASNEAGGSFHVAVDGTTVTGELTAPNTAGWQNYADVTAGGIALTAGTHVILLVEDTLSSGGLGVCNFNYLTFSLPATPTPTFTQTFTPTYTPTTVPPVCAAWTVQGSAFTSGQGVTLTTAANGEVGAAWNQGCINLAQDFNMTFKTYFGAPGGADGIDFVLQNDPRGTAAIASGGGNKGYSGGGAISPSVALDLETYNNNGTLQVLENGSTANTCAYAAGACPYVFPANIANQAEHSYQVVWSAGAKTLTLLFDGTVVMVYDRDLAASVFSGATCVTWGFTAATGGSNNLQYVYEVGCTAPTPTRSATPTATPSSTATPTRTGSASPSATGTGSPSPSPSATRSATATGSPTASPSASPSPVLGTPTASPSSSPSATGTASPSQSPTATPSPQFTDTPPFTPTPTPSATTTATASPVESDTPSTTASATPSATLSASPSSTPSASPSQTLTLTPSPTLSPSASPTQSPSGTQSATPLPSPPPTGTPTATATASPQPSSGPSGTPSATRAQTPTATAVATSGPAPVSDPSAPGGGVNAIQSTVPLPDPNPRALLALLEGDVDSVQARVYTRAMVCVAEATIGAGRQGWVSVPLPEGFLQTAPNGIYFYRIVGIRGSSSDSKPVVGRFLVLR